jgi:hypothetical protein
VAKGIGRITVSLTFIYSLDTLVLRMLFLPKSCLHRCSGPSIHPADRLHSPYQLRAPHSPPSFLPQRDLVTVNLLFFFSNAVNTIRGELILTRHVHRTNNDNTACAEPLIRNIQQQLFLPNRNHVHTPHTTKLRRACIVTRGRRDSMFAPSSRRASERACKARIF